MRKIRIWTAFFVSVALAIVRTVLVTSYMEKSDYFDHVYYLSENIFVTLFTVAACLFVVVSLACSVWFNKKMVVSVNKKDIAPTAAACMYAFLLLGTVVILGISVFNGELTLGFGTLALAILSIGTAISFLASAVRIRGDISLGLLTLFPILLYVVRFFYRFIATSAALNASSGMYQLVAVALLAAFFVCEGDAYLSRGKAFGFYFTGTCAILFILVYSVPTISLICMGSLSFDYNASLAAADIVAAVYVLRRMLSATSVLEVCPEGEE